MWGTTSPWAKLTGDSHNGFETALIGDCRLFLPLAENLPQCLWGLLQHYRAISGLNSDIEPCPKSAATSRLMHRTNDKAMSSFRQAGGLQSPGGYLIAEFWA